MFDDGIDLNTMGRKELQALAKIHGIKANQKSAILRDLLREVIAFQKPDDEQDRDENEEVKQKEPTMAENVQDELPRVAIDGALSPRTKQIGTWTKGEVSLDSSAPGEAFEESTVDEAIVPSKECSISRDVNCSDVEDRPESLDDHVLDTCYDQGTEEEENALDHSTDGETLDSTDSSESQSEDIDDRKNVEKVAVELIDQDENQDVELFDALNQEISKENFEQENEELKFIDDDGTSMKESTAVKAERKEKRTDTESDDPVGKQIPTINKKALASKISFGVEKSSTKKYRHLENKNEKFASKLDQSYRSRQRTKQPTKQPKNDSNHPTKTVSKKGTSGNQKEIPLWKMHARDFIRTRGPDVNHNLHSKEKKPSPTKSLKRRPFGDRSNNKMEPNGTKEKYDKYNVKKIPPKPQAMSKRNEDQMKLFLERQAAGMGETSTSKNRGNKFNVKRIPPKPQAMSKRNEEQMKRFLERQAAGRQDRARREEIRRIANCERS